MVSSQPITLQAGVSYVANPGGWNLGGYFFDAWLRLRHQTSMTATQHPVEVGAAITDHVFRNPRRFSFDIGMSDVATSIIPGQFPSSPTRSINAYQQIKNMQESRQPLTLVSKYGTYDNIIIESIDVADDWTTINAVKATINLMQIITDVTQVFQTSSDPQTTDPTNRGQVAPQPIPGTLQAITNDIEHLFGP